LIYVLFLLSVRRIEHRMAVTPAQGIELSDRKSSTAFSGEI
jgi:hypothetical protein